MEEKKTITAEELLKQLKPCMTNQEEKEWQKKAVENGMDEAVANLVTTAYKKGTMEYLSQYIDADTKLNELQQRYVNLTIKVCEKLI
jgi:glutamate mutase epsilon subunit